jgi:hypothetical protein
LFDENRVRFAVNAIFFCGGRAMLRNKCGFAGEITSSKGLLDPPRFAVSETGVVDGRAIANEDTACFGAGAIRRVEDHEITGKSSAVSRGEFGRFWIALPVNE